MAVNGMHCMEGFGKNTSQPRRKEERRTVQFNFVSLMLLNSDSLRLYAVTWNWHNPHADHRRRVHNREIAVVHRLVHRLITCLQIYNYYLTRVASHSIDVSLTRTTASRFVADVHVVRRADIETLAFWRTVSSSSKLMRTRTASMQTIGEHLRYVPACMKGHTRRTHATIGSFKTRRRYECDCVRFCRKNYDLR